MRQNSYFTKLALLSLIHFFYFETYIINIIIDISKKKLQDSTV